MRRFMHQQNCGKLRPIDDGRSSGHNAACWSEETIYTTSPDFFASACKQLVRAMRTDESWAQLAVGTADMQSAYRQIPNLPEEGAGLVVAYFDPDLGQTRYVILRAHPYGLAAAALNFNRVPALATALCRRVVGVCCTHYFDDTGLLDNQCSRGSGQAAVNEMYSGLGFILDPKKQQPMASQRHFLGVLLKMDAVQHEGVLRVDLKIGARENLAEDISLILQQGRCSSAEAAKLRGKFTWAATARPCLTSVAGAASRLCSRDNMRITSDFSGS